MGVHEYVDKKVQPVKMTTSFAGGGRFLAEAAERQKQGEGGGGKGAASRARAREEKAQNSPRNAQ